MPIDKRNKSDMYSILDKLRQSKQLEFDSEREKKPYYYDDADDWDEYPLPKSKPSDNDNYEEKPLNEVVGPIKNLLQMFDGSAEWLATLNKQLRSKINKKELQDILKKSEYKKVDDDIAKNPEAYIGNRVKKDNINEDEIDEGYAGAINFLRKLGGGGDAVKVIPDIKPIHGIDAYGDKIKPIEVSGSMSNPPTGNSMGIGKPMGNKNYSPFQTMADPNLPKISGEVNSMLTPKGTSASDLLDLPNRETFSQFTARMQRKKLADSRKSRDQAYDKQAGTVYGQPNKSGVLNVEPSMAEKLEALAALRRQEFEKLTGTSAKSNKMSKLKQKRAEAKARKNKKKT
jgi:hypothetical protein